MYEPNGPAPIRQLDISSLLSLAKSDPEHVLVVADVGLQPPTVDRLTSEEQARLMWARGVALFEMGRNGQAVSGLHMALQLASPDVRDHVSISLAAAEAASGQTSAAVERLQSVMAEGQRVVSALARSQLGLIELRRGELRKALSLLQDALPVLKESSTERRGLARVLLNLGTCHILLGEISVARPLLRQASEIAEQQDQRLVHAGALQNLGYAEARVGGLDQALDYLERARQIYAEAGDAARRNLATLFEDLCETYRFAGLNREALRYARLAAWSVRDGDDDEKQTDAEFQRALCLAEGGHLSAAHTFAERSRQAYLASGRVPQSRRAEGLLLEATPLGTHITEAVCDAAEQTAKALERSGWTSDATMARVRLAELLVANEQVDRALEVLASVPSPDPRSAPRERLEHTLAKAMRRYWEGQQEVREPDDTLLLDGWRQLSALRREIAEPEMRLIAGRLADRFRALELTAAVRRGDSAAAARGEARWRLLNGTTQEVAAADSASLHQRGLVHEGVIGSSVLEWAATGGQLCRIESGGTASLTICGSEREILDKCESLRRSLSRLVRPSLSTAQATQLAHTVSMQARALGAVLGLDREGRSPVVAPTGELVELPWRLMSATAILRHPYVPSERSRSAMDPDKAPAALIMGPGLGHVDRDVDAFLQAFPGAVIVGGADATIGRLAELLETTSFLHIAAHGQFDNHRSQRSSIALHNGDAKLRDIGLLRAVPDVVVMAACDAGRGETRVGGGHLGVTSTLLERGTECVIAPICAVPDQELAGVVEAFYRALPGHSPDNALRQASQFEIMDDPRSWATAHAMQCTIAAWGSSVVPKDGAWHPNS